MVREVADQGSVFFKRNSRQLLILAAATGLAIAGVKGYSSLQTQAQPSPVSLTPQVSTPQIKTVTALGRLEPKGEVIKLSAPSSPGQGSRVEKLLVKEGDKVKAGQVIAILDNRDRLEAAYQEAQEAVKVAQVNLEKVREGAKVGEIEAQRAEIARVQAQTTGDEREQQETVARLEAQWQGEKSAQQATVKRLEAELKNAQSEWERYQKLYADGAISQSSYDTKRLSVDTITQQLSEAQANLQRIDSTGRKQISEAKTALSRINTTGSKQVSAAAATLNKIAEVRPIDIQAAKVEVDRALAAAKQAKANLDQVYVRWPKDLAEPSPQDGVIFDIYTRAGEVVSTDGIVEIGRIDQMYAVVEVYQSDVNKVRTGQKVEISSKSLPGKLRGTVDQIGWKVQRQNIINSDPSENIDSRVVEVHVQLDEASSQKAAKFTNLQVTAVIEL
ncbi:heterocyst specific ABC-transporter, membrane fusion protein DevB [Trichormus variabilis ATCC 29413]|uniref:Heterocyst specific ABC-transporter, membrane fusion protein DevB n=2 Tax=Anabaena variabilis TaxID=264691 RepID=Q3MDT0_TRIV2|nr:MULTISPECIES: ABC exporter membrane fusion protein [Nostocaceae]ABA20856.1 heterocyst specific ABC-transporter, membrane fusion protein DevB [Trichormus variabilis ATCC 29413]MBC1215664.1 ABC exporter membrane fusion protein [Trichormus variabilis ARAD]MBC1255901.1 ABC exporter membrane fusion protein [Trichormus variabilis V5]MBC1266588.1 ABC exporter membrane fusion protein [Trichormus variabilis FSR]MBC1302988.1 ABC exporter membrane fusion protein [Trichormus variabilis N2B]